VFANDVGFANTAIARTGRGGWVYDRPAINARFLPFEVTLRGADGAVRRERVAALVGLDNLFAEANPGRWVRVDYGMSTWRCSARRPARPAPRRRCRWSARCASAALPRPGRRCTGRGRWGSW